MPRPRSIFYMSVSIAILYYILYYMVTSLEDISMVKICWATEQEHRSGQEIRNCTSQLARVSYDSYNCISDADVVLFSSNDIHIDRAIPRKRRQLWGLWHDVKPATRPLMMHHEEFLKHFNVTATFSSQSTLPLLFLDAPKSDDFLSDEFAKTLEHKQTIDPSKRIGDIVFIANQCPDIIGFQELFDSLNMQYPIDSYGGCKHNREPPERLKRDIATTTFSPELKQHLAEYKFWLIIEPMACMDYISPEYWIAMSIGVVPIYFGAPNVKSWEPYPDSGIYIGDYDNFRTLSQAINITESNSTIYAEFFHYQYTLDPDSVEFVNFYFENMKKYVYRDSFGVGPIEEFECRALEAMSTYGRKNHDGRLNIVERVVRTATDVIYQCPLDAQKIPLTSKDPEAERRLRHKVQDVGGCYARAFNEYWTENKRNPHYTGIRDCRDKYGMGYF